MDNQPIIEVIGEGKSKRFRMVEWKKDEEVRICWVDLANGSNDYTGWWLDCAVADVETAIERVNTCSRLRRFR